jgi:hypothetical protein
VGPDLRRHCPCVAVVLGAGVGVLAGAGIGALIKAGLVAASFAHAGGIMTVLGIAGGVAGAILGGAIGFGVTGKAWMGRAVVGSATSLGAGAGMVMGASRGLFGHKTRGDTVQVNPKELELQMLRQEVAAAEMAAGYAAQARQMERAQAVSAMDNACAVTGHVDRVGRPDMTQNKAQQIKAAQVQNAMLPLAPPTS